MSKPKPFLRPATVMDSVNLVRLIRAGWEESPAFGVAPLDDTKLMDYVQKSLKHCFCVVVEQDRRILGSVCLVPFVLPWASNVLALAEGWFIVQASQRRKGISELLLGAVERFLDDQKLIAIMGSNLLAPPEMSEPMNGRPGYTPVRLTYLRFPNRHVDEQGRPVMPPKVAGE